MQKTNAMRILEREKIAYTPHSYEVADGLIDGLSVARKAGEDPERVFKTLVTQGGGELFVFCIPVTQELGLKEAAAVAGVKSLAMLPAAQLLARTGYVHGGCSPVGMKKRYKTFLHHSAERYDSIWVSGGKVGLQIELAPQALIKVVGASLF